VSKGDEIEVRGRVTEVLPNAMFRVSVAMETATNETVNQSILAHIAGSMRKNRIRVLLDDEVLVVMTPYDLTKGRITYRFK